MLIHRDAIKAVLPATTSEDTRYFLKAIQVQPTGRIVATNGHIAITATTTEPMPDADFPLVPGAPFAASPAGNVLIDDAAAKKVISATPKRATVPVLAYVQLSTNGSPDSYTLAGTDLGDTPIVATIKDGNGTFPDVDRVIPAADKADCRKLVLGIPVLEAMIKAAKAVQGSKPNAAIRFDIPPANKSGDIDTPIRFTVSGENANIVGAVMGMRL